MYFLKDKSKRINLLFVKEFGINANVGNSIFSLKYVDRKNHVNYINVDILKLITVNKLDQFIIKTDMVEIINKIKDLSKRDLEKYNNINNLIYSIKNDDEEKIYELDVEEIVFKNTEKVIDEYIYRKENE